MKYPLLLILMIFLGMLFIPSASGVTSGAANCCADDTTGTGGSLPNMEWGDTAQTTTALPSLPTCADTAVCYDLNGRVMKTINGGQLMIRNGKCRVLR